MSSILLFAGSIYVSGQDDSSELLKNKKITIKMDKQPLGKVFRHLMLDYDIPIGFEESTFDLNHNDYEFETILPVLLKRHNSENKETNPLNEGSISIKVEPGFEVKENWITVNAENSPLEQVLDSIVEQMKNYKWEINDEVVNIIPVQGRDSRYEKLLNLEIKEYAVSKDRNFGAIRNKIFKLPEVRNFLLRNV